MKNRNKKRRHLVNNPCKKHCTKIETKDFYGIADDIKYVKRILKQQEYDRVMNLPDWMFEGA